MTPRWWWQRTAPHRGNAAAFARAHRGRPSPSPPRPPSRGTAGAGAGAPPAGPDTVPRIAGYRSQDEKSRIDRVLQALARSRPGGWLFITVFPAIDRRLMPLSRGRLRVAMGQPILLLHTRGARSGEPRTSPLLYTPHRDAFVVVASKAGAASHPAWYHNLVAHPDDVAVEIGGRRMPVRPRLAEGAERERLWRIVNDNYNGYETYQGRAGGRVIPVVVLEPGGGGAPAAPQAASASAASR